MRGRIIPYSGAGKLPLIFKGLYGKKAVKMAEKNCLKAAEGPDFQWNGKSEPASRRSRHKPAFICG
jgi:hypothetical protein